MKVENFKHALQELKSIACFYKIKEIDSWIETNIKEAYWKVELHYPNEPVQAEHYIKQAMYELGRHIAENSNMYPKWIPGPRGQELYVSTLYFKNEFGK